MREDGVLCLGADRYSLSLLVPRMHTFIIGNGSQGQVTSVESMKKAIRYNGYPNEVERFG